jgi:Ca2+-binding RTX toxin-like protein
VSSGSGAVLTTAEQHISLQIGPDDNAPPAFDFQTNKTLYNLTHETYATLTDPLFILNTGTNVLGTITNLAPFKSTDVNVSLVEDDLVLTHTIGAAQKTLTLESYTGDLKGDKIQFLDGSTLQYEDGSTGGSSAKSVLYGTANPDHLILATASTAGGTLKGYMDADKLEGSAGRDVLYGGDGDDRIVGYGGNDYLNGGHGADTFVFGATDGSDVIADFTIGSDKLSLPNDQAIVVSQSGSDTLITINGSNSIRLMGVSSTNNVGGVITSAITLDNFELYGINTINISSILVGTPGVDSILAGPGSDTIIGGLGADSIDIDDDVDGDVVIKYNTSRESTLDSVDTITGLVLNGNSADRIDLPSVGTLAVIALQPSSLASSALTEQNINILVGTGVSVTDGTQALENKFAGGGNTDIAVLTTTDDSKTFLAIDLDGNGAFSAATDMLIEITGATNGNAGIPANITIGSFI